MGRPLRDFFDGVFHLCPRASDERQLFFGDGDRKRFLELLSATFQKLMLELLSYSLMGNHYHAVVYTPDARLSAALQRLHTEYSRSHNLAHGRKAHLFHAHCPARRIVDDADLIGVHRYVALNAVEAGFVRDPLDWRWSSTRAHAGLERPTITLAQRRLRAALGDAADWRNRYAELIAVDEHPLAPRT
jgi:REP element-mobilizing transposase RayT